MVTRFDISKVKWIGFIIHEKIAQQQTRSGSFTAISRWKKISPIKINRWAGEHLETHLLRIDRIRNDDFCAGISVSRFICSLMVFAGTQKKSQCIVGWFKIQNLSKFISCDDFSQKCKKRKKILKIFLLNHYKRL